MAGWAAEPFPQETVSLLRAVSRLGKPKEGRATMLGGVAAATILIWLVYFWLHRHMNGSVQSPASLARVPTVAPSHHPCKTGGAGFA